MRREVGAALVAACVLAIAALAYRGERRALLAPASPPAPPAPAAAPASVPFPELPGAPSLPDAVPQPPLERPASLVDSDVDGELAVDANGQFLATREALRLFDYFLSTSGEEPDTVILARIHAEIDARLPAAAAPAARELLARYLVFRERANLLFAAGGAALTLEERLARVRALRREAFGEEAAARLFAHDEQREAFALEAQRRLSDPQLDAQGRRAALEDLAARMPPAVAAERAAALGPLRLQQDEAALRAAGGSDEEVRVLRERAVGAEAADRLEQLDEQRAEWNRRLAAYRAERDALGAADEAEIAALRARHFDETERVRVQALDEIVAGDGRAP